jgi:hypothetical protein
MCRALKAIALQCPQGQARPTTGFLFPSRVAALREAEPVDAGGK